MIKNIHSRFNPINRKKRIKDLKCMKNALVNYSALVNYFIY
jgi:hypothetical protein